MENVSIDKLEDFVYRYKAKYHSIEIKGKINKELIYYMLTKFPKVKVYADIETIDYFADYTNNIKTKNIICKKLKLEIDNLTDKNVWFLNRLTEIIPEIYTIYEPFVKAKICNGSFEFIKRDMVKVLHKTVLKNR